MQVAIAESSKHYVVDGLLTEGNVGASSNALDSGTNVSFCEAPDDPASLMIKDIILDSLYQVAVQMSGIGLLENARSSSLGCQCGYPQATLKNETHQ